MAPVYEPFSAKRRKKPAGSDNLRLDAIRRRLAAVEKATQNISGPQEQDETIKNRKKVGY